MLSSQQHYDWGLRALKTVLRGCGDLLRKSPEQEEMGVIVQALNLNTLSKLTFSDSRRFAALVQDVFSNVNQVSAQVRKHILGLNAVTFSVREPRRTFEYSLKRDEPTNVSDTGMG